MPDRDAMEKYLRFLAQPIPNLRSHEYPALILAKGQWFAGRGHSDEYDVAKDWKKKKKPKMKECFHNAQAFCIDHDEGRYFEGFVWATTGTPVRHGWVVMPDDRIVDFTLEVADKHLRTDGAGRDTSTAGYFGVHVPTEFVLMQMLQTQAYEPVAELYVASEPEK